MSDYTNPATLSDLANLLAPHLMDRLGIDNTPRSAPVSTSPLAQAAQTAGGVNVAMVNDLINAHAAKGYSTGHAQDPDTGTYFGVHWGITGGTEDQSQKLLDMLNDVGGNGGGHIILRSTIPTNPLVFRKLTSIYHDNITLEFKSPQVFGKVGGLRIMGSMDEYTREISPGVFYAAGKLRANAEIGDTVLQLKTSPSSMQAANFVDGDYIVVRGLNGADGNSLQKQYFYVLSRDLINNNLNLSSEVEEGPFQPTYTTGDSPIDHSDYPDDATTGTTIYIVRNGQFLANVSRGAYSFDVTNIANFKIGQLVRIADSRNEHDMNPSALRSSGLPYENECNMEFAKIINVVPIGGGPTGTVTIDHAISKNYLAGAPYYGGISVVLPVKNSRIIGLNVTYDEIQENKNDHAITIAFAEDCHVQYGAIYGAKYDPTTHALLAGRWGQALRFSDCYGCTASDLLIDDAAASGSGQGYGATIYKSTGVVLRNIIARGCRHNFLVQAATLFLIDSCESWGDRISGFDLHGALEFDGVIQNCKAVRSLEHTDDAANGAGFRCGNTSHTPGSWYIKFINCIATGYQETNCAGFDFLPNSYHIDIVVCQVYGAYYGIMFTRNSSQVTPVQDVESVRIFGCVMADCTQQALRVIGAPTYAPPSSNGKVLNLSIKQTVTVRCPRHFVIAGNNGVSNVLIEGCDVLEPIALAGAYAYDIEGVLGFVRFRNNSGAGANRGVKFTNCVNVLGHSNTMTPTLETIPFTDGGGNTALAYVDPFDAVIGSTADHLIATANTIVGTGVKGTYIQGAGTDGVRFWAGYTGYGAYWDGVNWKVGTDGVTNAASLTMAEGLTGGLRKFVFPNTGGVIQTVAPGALASFEVPELAATAFDARGDLLVGLADNVYSRVPLGVTPGMVLTVHPDNDAGVYWAAPPSSFTGNVVVTSTTPAFWLAESDGPAFKQNWAWVASSGSMRLRLYSDDFTSSIDNIFFRRGVANDLTEIEFLPMKIGIGIAPTRTLHVNGTVKISAADEGWTSAGWQKALELEEGQVIQWLRGGATISRGIGFTSDGALYVMRSTANGAAGTMFYDMIMSANGNTTFGSILTVNGVFWAKDRMELLTGASGSAGIWYNDISGSRRAFVGLYDDDATPIWGTYIGGAWRFYINQNGEASFSGPSGLSPIAGVPLSVGGIIRSYQQNDFRYYSAMYLTGGVAYHDSFDTTGGTFIASQHRGLSVSLAVGSTGAVINAFRATIGINYSDMPMYIINNNTYREALGGSLVIGNSDGYSSHFYHGPLENTYIRSKFGSTVILGDSGHVSIGVAGYITTIQGNWNGWTALSFTTNYSNYSSGDTPGRYRKIGDIVFIEGFVKRASGNTDVIIATLPSGFRPAKDWTRCITIRHSPGGTPTDLNVWITIFAANGDIKIIQPASLLSSTLTFGFIDLNGLCFSLL